MRDLQKDLELCQRATPGPWKITREDIGDEYVCITATEIHGADGFAVVSSEGGIAPISAHQSWKTETVEANAEFITQAREGWPEAIHRAMEAEEENAELKIELTAARSRIVDLEKALELASERIDGYCPADELGEIPPALCGDWCRSDTSRCWKKYLLMKARGELEPMGKV